jgi:hypothetical protein
MSLVKPAGKSNSKTGAGSAGWGSGNVGAGAGVSVPARTTKPKAESQSTAIDESMSKISFSELKAMGKMERDKKKPDKLIAGISTPSPAMESAPEPAANLPKPPSPALLENDFPTLPPSKEKPPKNKTKQQASEGGASSFASAAVVHPPTPPVPPPSRPSPSLAAVEANVSNTAKPPASNKSASSAATPASGKVLKASESWVPKLGGSSESASTAPTQDNRNLDNSEYPTLAPAPRKASAAGSGKKIVVIGASGVKVMTTNKSGTGTSTKSPSPKLSADLQQILSTVKK